MTGTAADLIRVAKGQLGYTEQGGRDGRSGNITKFGKAFGLDGYAWCSMFVWWCFREIGIDVRHDVSSLYAGAEQAMRGFAFHGWKVVKNPRPGDVVFFQFDTDPIADHTGIVVEVGTGGVWTVEGNTSPGTAGSQSNGGGVYQRWRPDAVIIGYGRYPFPTPKPLPAPAPTRPVAARKYPVLQLGSRGENVRRLERLLHIPVDRPGHGLFGPQCDRAVRAFQKRRHLLVDGIAGPATLRALGF